MDDSNKNNTITHGDFSKLAENYSKYRPKYSESALDAIIALTSKSASELDVVDIGAGTGIWSRMLAERACHSVVAVEPNAIMRSYGIRDSKGSPIEWKEGSAESTGLQDDSVDLLTMASSFNWVNFDAALREFNRVIRPGGCFAALWNPRLVEANPLLVEIENKLFEMVPELKRISSGRSGVTETLTERLEALPYLNKVACIEKRHVEHQTPDHYIGVWWSVNDVQVQAGEKRFKAFMDYIAERIDGLEYIEATYLTRVWVAQ